MTRAEIFHRPKGANGGLAIAERPARTRKSHADGNGGSKGMVIVLAERRTLVRECMTRGLEYLASCVVISVASVREWLERSPRALPSLVVLSTLLESGNQALVEDTTALEQSGVSAPVVVVSDMEALPQVLSVLKAGVRGYIPTSLPLPVALEAMRLVSAGGTYIPAESVLAASATAMLQPTWKSTNQDLFTTRQLQVVEALRRGRPNKLIAYELNMCESTVKVHVRQIMKKLNARNRTEAAFKANEFLRPREFAWTDGDPSASGRSSDNV
jgi:DNA-binding NarL/FixJ family response regulator